MVAAVGTADLTKYCPMDLTIAGRVVVASSVEAAADVGRCRLCFSLSFCSQAHRYCFAACRAATAVASAGDGGFGSLLDGTCTGAVREARSSSAGQSCLSSGVFEPGPGHHTAGVHLLHAAGPIVDSRCTTSSPSRLTAGSEHTTSSASSNSSSDWALSDHTLHGNSDTHDHRRQAHHTCTA